MRPKPHSQFHLRSVPVLGVSAVRKAARMPWLAGRGWAKGAFGYLREVLVDIFSRLLEEAFKLISSPLQTEQTDYRGQWWTKRTSGSVRNTVSEQIQWEE